MSPADPFKRQIKTPSSLAVEIQENFDGHFGALWVEGEVSELAAPFSGHLYFSLKDKTAKLKAVMWKGRRAYGGSQLVEGATVLVKGRLSVYAPRGDYQLVADYVEAKGEGALRLAFEKLKARLANEGLFAEERKRPLPFWPRKVAVISSPAGAAVHDFIGTSLELRPRADIALYPVKVQGQGAAGEMVQALADLNAWGGFDLIVITRGGGSLEDLWAFNEEVLVRAVASSRIPVLAAVGHSTDETLAELAADQRAITPTAAARAVYRDAGQMAAHLAESQGNLGRILSRILQEKEKDLKYLERALTEGAASAFHRQGLRLKEFFGRLKSFEHQLSAKAQTLDYLALDLGRSLKGHLKEKDSRLRGLKASLLLLSPARLLESFRARLEGLESLLLASEKRGLEDQARRLAYLEESLKRLSPLSILKRGYALVRNEKGDLVFSDKEARPGEEIDITLADGGLKASVMSRK